MISIRNLRKNYGSVLALAGVSLDVGKGDFFGLLGPNGAGKSTLLNILAGYLLPDEGTVTVSGLELRAQPAAVRRMIGFVPQEVALYSRLSAWENVLFFGSLYGLKRAVAAARGEKLLRAVGLWDRRKDAVEKFSGGMKRRLNIITSLVHQPVLLMCDEPTAGVDPQSRNAIFDFLRAMHSEGTTIIYTTHYMEEAERLCSRIAIVDHGLLISQGTLDELLLHAPDRPSIVIAVEEGAAIETEGLKKFGSVIQSDGLLRITPVTTQVRISELLGELERRGIAYQDVRFERPTLESLFLQLTGRSLRE